MTLLRAHHSWFVAIVAAGVGLRLLTPTWMLQDYAGGIAVVFGVVFGVLFCVLVFAAFALMILDMGLDLGCPLKQWVGERLGYSYKNTYSCSQWTKKESPE